MPTLGIRRPEPLTTPLANTRALDDGTGILMWYGDKALGAMKAMMSYIPLDDLQVITLTYTVTKMGFEVSGPNLFTSATHLYAVEGNAGWIQDMLESKPVIFTKKLKATGRQVSGFSLPPFRPSSLPVEGRE